MFGVTKRAWDVMSGVTKRAWDVLSGGGKSLWDILSGLSKNGMGCFSRDVLSGSPLALSNWWPKFKWQCLRVLHWSLDSLEPRLRVCYLTLESESGTGSLDSQALGFNTGPLASPMRNGLVSGSM